MKRTLLVTFLTVLMFFPAAGVFAQMESNSEKKGVAADLSEHAPINAFRADKIIGSDVMNLDGKRIGSIDNLVVDINTGNILYAVLEFGGFMDIGDKLFAVPWPSLTSVPAEGIFILDQSKAKLEKAPGFDKNNWPDIGDRRWGAGIYEYYRRHIPIPQPPAPETYSRNPAENRGYRPYPGYTTSPYPNSNVWGDVYGELFNPDKIETVTGKIVKVEYYAGVRILLYTDAKKPILAVLGPVGYLESQEKVLQIGNTVTLTGSKVTLDDTPFIIATKIREGNEEMQLRDNQGHPIWLGWKKIK